jgi:hypothetical protein
MLMHMACYLQVVPGSFEDKVIQLLERAWKEDSLTALKLVFHLRGVRGTGKSDKEMFYWAALWLQKHHPGTLLENLNMVAEFGYFKDLLEILLRLVEEPEERVSKIAATSRHKEGIDLNISTSLRLQSSYQRKVVYIEFVVALHSGNEFTLH